MRTPFSSPGPTFQIAIPGQSFYVQVELLNQSPDPVGVESVKLEASDGKAWKIAGTAEAKKSLAAGELTQARFSVTAPADAALTRPYFTRPDEEQASYDLADPRYRNLSLAPYPLSVSAEFSYRGASRAFGAGGRRAMQRISTLGIVAQPLLMGPALSVTVSPAAGAVPVGAEVVRLFLHRTQQCQRGRRRACCGCICRPAGDPLPRRRRFRWRAMAKIAR